MLFVNICNGHKSAKIMCQKTYTETTQSDFKVVCRLDKKDIEEGVLYLNTGLQTLDKL